MSQRKDRGWAGRWWGTGGILGWGVLAMACQPSTVTHGPGPTIGDPATATDGDDRGDRSVGDPAESDSGPGDQWTGDFVATGDGDGLGGDPLGPGDSAGDGAGDGWGDGGGDGDGPGNGDGGVDPLWAHCPTAADYVGSNWGFALNVVPDGLFCTQPTESLDLTTQLRRKTFARIVPGIYPIPDQSITQPVPFRLPVCFRFHEGEPPLLDSVGTVTANIYGSDYYVMIRQPMRTPAGKVWDLRITIWGTRGALQDELVVDGRVPADSSGMGGGPLTMVLCNEADCWGSPFPSDQRGIAGCDFSALPLHRHQVRFTSNDGGISGTLTVGLRIGFSMASTEPSMFESATGSLDGVPIEQRAFVDLVYSPTHHHFERRFGTVLDSPIAGWRSIVLWNLEVAIPGYVDTQVFMDRDGDLEDDPLDPNDWQEWKVVGESYLPP